MLGDRDLVTLVPVTDPERARAFYEGTLGLTHTSTDPFAVELASSARRVRLTKVPELTPHPFAILAWTVDDARQSAAALAEAGVELVRYGFLEQDDLGVWTAPGGGAKVAWFHDLDGNLLSILEG